MRVLAKFEDSNKIIQLDSEESFRETIAETFQIPLSSFKVVRYDEGFQEWVDMEPGDICNNAKLMVIKTGLFTSPQASTATCSTLPLNPPGCGISSLGLDTELRTLPQVSNTACSTVSEDQPDCSISSLDIDAASRMRCSTPSEENLSVASSHDTIPIDNIHEEPPKVDAAQWPMTFTLPTLPRHIKHHLNELKSDDKMPLQKNIRKEIINILFNKMRSYTMYPAPCNYQEVGSMLVKTYPVLRDRLASRGCYYVVCDTEQEDDHSLDKHKKIIAEEMKKKKASDDVIRDRMARCSNRRRLDIVHGKSTCDVLTDYPCLGLSKWILEEMNMLCNVKIVEQLSSENTIAVIRRLKKLSLGKWQKIPSLVKRLIDEEEICWLMTLPSLWNEDELVLEKSVSTPYPVIVARNSEDEQITVWIDGCQIRQSSNYVEAIAAMISCYWVFNLVIPKGKKKSLGFMAAYLLHLPNAELPMAVVKLVNKL
uniref:uncharacterized protein LOC120336130 isoform X1 n=1 Tax=Styela clava TaxID=7725 RepID=UPI001939436C|nr:uncharacterized protein LOC120336130 isoform X1 [Styela clava]